MSSGAGRRPRSPHHLASIPPSGMALAGPLRVASYTQPVPHDVQPPELIRGPLVRNRDGASADASLSRDRDAHNLEVASMGPGHATEEGLGSFHAKPGTGVGIRGRKL